MYDFDGLVSDGRLVSVDIVAYLITITDKLVYVGFFAVDTAYAFVYSPDVVLLCAVSEFGGHNLDQFPSKPSLLGERLELEPVRRRLP